MNQSEVPAGLQPCSFALTALEAETAASRAGLRAALSGRLSASHIAPLVGFVLFVAFVAILAATGLLARRLGEAAMIGGALVFMASRMAGHWRLRGARKSSLAAMAALREAGEVTARLDEDALRIESAAGSRRLAFADCDEAEEAGGIIYLWPRSGGPAFIPARAFADEQMARAFLAFARAGIARAVKRGV